MRTPRRHSSKGSLPAATSRAAGHAAAATAGDPLSRRSTRRPRSARRLRCGGRWRGRGGWLGRSGAGRSSAGTAHTAQPARRRHRHCLPSRLPARAAPGRPQGGPKLAAVDQRQQQGVCLSGSARGRGAGGARGLGSGSGSGGTTVAALQLQQKELGFDLLGAGTMAATVAWMGAAEPAAVPESPAGAAAGTRHAPALDRWPRPSAGSSSRGWSWEAPGSGGSTAAWDGERQGGGERCGARPALACRRRPSAAVPCQRPSRTCPSAKSARAVGPPLACRPSTRVWLSSQHGVAPGGRPRSSGVPPGPPAISSPPSTASGKEAGIGAEAPPRVDGSAAASGGMEEPGAAVQGAGCSYQGVERSECCGWLGMGLLQASATTVRVGAGDGELPPSMVAPVAALQAPLNCHDLLISPPTAAS